MRKLDDDEEKLSHPLVLICRRLSSSKGDEDGRNRSTVYFLFIRTLLHWYSFFLSANTTGYREAIILTIIITTADNQKKTERT
jgi:hypothetical protein